MKTLKPLFVLLAVAATAGAQQITNVVETGGDNEATDTIAAQWTGQTFTVSVNGEPLPESLVGDEYTVGRFGDLAPAFVDRNHRYINTSSSSTFIDPPVEIPPYLLDLPYIMSGNDNRDNNAYRLEVTVDQAARVYMLIDNRLSNKANDTPPVFGPATMQWILDENWQPMLTGNNRLQDPGIPDEFPFDEGANGDIQQWYSIYYRDVPAGTFTLRQADNPGRNMYGAVVGPLPPPTDPIQVFTAQPTSIAFGQKATLSWQISPTATVATIDNGIGDVKPLTNAQGAGSIEITPTASGIYTMTVNTPGGNETASAAVTIQLIASFTATPAALTPGQSSTLAWSVFPGATVEIDPIGNVTGMTDAAGQGTLVVTPTVPTRYTLTATRQADTATASVGVGFVPPAQRYALIDLGGTGSQVEPGATGDRVIGAGPADTNLVDLATETLTSDTGDEFTLTLDAMDPDGFAVGGLDWRDRGNAGTEPLARLGEDLVKNNLGMIRVTLGSLPAGSYNITSYHLDPSFSQAEEIRILVSDAVSGATPADTGVIASAAYPDHPLDTFAVTVAGLNTFTVSEKGFTFPVTSNGVGDVIVYFDSRLSPLDDEVPLAGLLIVPAAAPPAPPATLTIALVEGNQIRLSWPTTAPAGTKLQTSTSLATQSWGDDTRPVTVVGLENVVIGPLDGPVRFFRLLTP